MGGLLIQATAQAIPIGDFNWDEHSPAECDAGLCGPVFFVDNFSDDPDFSLGAAGGTFLDVLVNLQTDQGAVTESLGDIGTESSSQSIDDLSGLSIVSAALTLTFGSGSLELLDADGNVETGLTAPGSLLIDYVPASGTGGGPTPVPEPPMALLFASALAALAVSRKIKRSRGLPGA